MPQPKKIEILPSYLNKMINSHLSGVEFKDWARGGGGTIFSYKINTSAIWKWQYSQIW